MIGGKKICCKELQFAFVALLLAACASEGGEVAENAALSAAANAVGAADAGPAASSDSREFIKQDIEELRSPFTRETVLRLNEIVGRSLAALDEYDANVKSIRAAVDAATGASAGDEELAAAKAGVAKVSDLHDRATLALGDMRKAEADLKSSGEVFNAAILAGMVKFVVDAESELGEEKAALSEKLNSAGGAERK